MAQRIANEASNSSSNIITRSPTCIARARQRHGRRGEAADDDNDDQRKREGELVGHVSRPASQLEAGERWMRDSDADREPSLANCLSPTCGPECAG